MTSRLSRKIVVIAFCFLLGLFIVPPAANLDIEGIHLGETLVESQTFMENFLYRNRVKKVLAGDSEALASLVMSDCGGGSGCYDHGEVLAKLLIRVGDAKFSQMVATLNEEEQSMLYALFEAGFEYGHFPKIKSRPNFDAVFRRQTE